MNEITFNYKVYIKINVKNEIIAINSSAFLTDTEGWIEIDSGVDDRHHHAQNNYLPKPLYYWPSGAFRYKWTGTDIEELPDISSSFSSDSILTLSKINADLQYLSMMTGINLD